MTPTPSRNARTVDVSEFTTSTGSSIIEAVALDEVQHFDVEGEAVDRAGTHHDATDVRPKRFAPALGVPIVAEQHQARGHVDHPTPERAHSEVPASVSVSAW